MLVIVFGLPGSGKSYFASRLANMIDADYINSDKLRKQLLDEKTYSEQEKLLVYYEILTRIKLFLKQNRSMVLDASFYKNDIRNMFIGEIESGKAIIFIEVIADEKLIRERLMTPRTESDADFKIYKKIKEQWEPLKKPHLALESTDDNINQMLDKAAEYLHIKQ